MLVAMAITLVMMGAVVTLFANVSNSVRDRRATIEMSGQLRHARNMLQQDLQGATCPGLTWRRPEENQGYIEIIEGPYREGNASALLDYDPDDTSTHDRCNPEIDHTTSIIPTSNLLDTTATGKSKWVTDGAGLGDGDDILMLTVRNEHEPFVGNMPANVRPRTCRMRTRIDSPTGRTSNDRIAAWPKSFGTRSRIPATDDQTDNHEQFLWRAGNADDLSPHALDRSWVNPYRLHRSEHWHVIDTFPTAAMVGRRLRHSRAWCEFLPAATARQTKRLPA